jgi:hypothetical protein
MNTTEKIKELEQEIERLKKLQEPEEILYEDDNLKIIKWENKPIRDLPKGTELATFQEFVDLVDSGKFKMEKPHFDYYTKHFSKAQWNEEYCLSRVYLSTSGNLSSVISILSDLDGTGRVCISKHNNERNNKLRVVKK